jgi:hypothetical protein
MQGNDGRRQFIGLVSIFGHMMRFRMFVLGAASLSLGPLVAQTNPASVASSSPQQHYDAQTHQPIYRKSYSLVNRGPVYKGIYYNPEYVDGVSWGMWYSNESMTDPQALAQNPDYFNTRGGWGTEFLSGNLFPKISPKFKPTLPANWQSKGWGAADIKSHLENNTASRGALYAGFGMGMGFYGRGDRNNVTLNTLREDSGYTFLTNYSVSLWGKLHYERKLQLSGVVLYPFTSVAVGPRIFTTNQEVHTYLTLTDYESPTGSNVYTKAVFASEFCLGTKIKLGQAVSLLVSQSFWSSGDIDVVDLSQSKFNGLAYDLQKVRMNTTQSQFKVGLVFDLSERRYYSYKVSDNQTDTIWYYEAQMPPPVDSFVYDSATKTMVKVKYFTCPCCVTNHTGSAPNMHNGAVPIYTPAKPAPVQREPARFNDNNASPNRNSGGFGSSSGSNSSGSSGKRPAPSISAPKIKN